MNPYSKPVLIAIGVLGLLLLSCREQTKVSTGLRPLPSNEVRTALEDPFLWEASTVYFLLTDRFLQDSSAAVSSLERPGAPAYLRGFEGGNFAGITQKIEEGYFDRLGVNVLWMSPVVEQIHGIIDEGTGPTHGYHGYWTKDWTSFEPSYGTKEEFARMVGAAHSKGIRILMDVVLNHTGPVTPIDPAWPEEWVRTTPRCSYDNYERTTACTLVDNLPDVITESNEAVGLPESLLDKWKKEGRLDQELEELEAFFTRTGFPRAPRFYIIKWLTDYVREYGIDGFRVDTAKHVNETVWSELRQEADYAFDQWKHSKPEIVLDDRPFFMVGEVYGYNITHGRNFPFGDKEVDYYAYGFDALINFEHKSRGEDNYEDIFIDYRGILDKQLQGLSVMNYTSSHDDAYSYDRERNRPFHAANMLLLSPGIAQIYYGDETSRPLLDEKANGDAALRTLMNWDELKNTEEKQEILEHWRRLGSFRRKHPSIGAGAHELLGTEPYSFSRTMEFDGGLDRVVVALDAPAGEKTIATGRIFADGELLWDAYSQQQVRAQDGQVTIDSPFELVLLEPLDD